MVCKAATYSETDSRMYDEMYLWSVTIR